MGYSNQGNNGTDILMTGPNDRPRILVVDDDPMIRTIITDALSPDYVCVGATSAEQAQDVLHQDDDFRLIISDVRMGKMNGIEFVRYTHEHYNHIPIIVMSGASEIDIAVAALRARADDYLVKPFDIIELADAVLRALQSPAGAIVTEEQIRELRWNASSKALAIALGAKDNETDGHAARVVHFSLRLGREMRLPREHMVALKLGSRLHDIGKIGVDERVLRKPARLDEGEWEMMKTHPTKGMEMVIAANLPEAAARVVGQHHEWWNGSGYPSGLSGDEIDLAARIFSVIDAFDAITSDRCYRRAQDYDAALDELRRYAGTQFDPSVVEAFALVPHSDWDDIRSLCSRDESSLTSEDGSLASVA
ncbi:MAG: HD domain-containing phosphohydrolase [Pyrinomonadaceae bacterium]